MIDIPVATVMTEPAPLVPPETSTVEAASQLRRADVPALVVSDSTDAVVGVVTESDIVAVVAERGGDWPVESYMSTPVVTTLQSTPIGHAADRMHDAGISLLPVVDDEDTPKGLVTRAALEPYLSRHRLDIDWAGEPLALEATDTPDAISTE